MPTKVTGQSHTTVPGQPDNGLVDTFPSPQALAKCLEFSLPEAEGRGKDGLLDVVARVLRYSVNTWDQGFLDKLYASTNAVGVVSEMVLAVLNTNVGAAPV